MTTRSIPRISGDAGDEATLDALREFGAVIVEDMIRKSDVDSILAEVAGHVEAADPDMEHVNDVMATFFTGVRNVTGLAGKSPSFVESLMLNPVLLTAAEAVLGPNCADFALNVAHLMVREPGAPRQWLHRDEEVWSFLPSPHPDIELSSVTALGDFTRENGATAVVAGSHLWDRERRPEEYEIEYAEMPAGAAVVYLGSTIHAGGANRSRLDRAGIHLSYVAGWLRPEENNCLATPPHRARELPRRAQELLGYSMHDATAVGGGYLGCVDLRDPADLLAAGEL